MNPNIKDDDIMPATLSKELLTDLLRANGLQRHGAHRRQPYGPHLPHEAQRHDPRRHCRGCDMFLFFNDMDEDFASMMNGYKNGVITDERLDDALHRILALKAHMGLHKGTDRACSPAAEMEGVIGCAAHRPCRKKSPSMR